MSHRGTPMKRNWFKVASLVVLGSCFNIHPTAQYAYGTPFAHRMKIKSFSVEISDDTLTYPTYLVDIPDEHTTVIPTWAWPYPGADTYLVFASSSITGGSGGAVVLETTDLTHFDSAIARGYAEQVMAPPISIKSCDP